MLKIYIAKDIFVFLLSMNSMLDIMTIIPYIIVSAYFGITDNDYNNEAIVLVRMMDIWRLYHFFRFVK